MKLDRVKLAGPLGRALELSVKERLKKVDYRQLVDPFRYRNETDDAWRCEFWGKIVRSAILSNASVRDPELADIIRKTVYDLLSTQTQDGCVSSYPADRQLGGWDIWGRKYVLHGLVRYYEFASPDEAVKTAAVRVLDHLIGQLDGRPIRDFGWHDGLAASSICDAVVGVYRISGEKRFFDFARKIIADGASKKHDVFASALAGVPPDELGNGKAYEMTSCFQGLAELAMLSPDPHAAAICRKYYEMVRDREIFVTGVGGGGDQHGEYWCHGAREQLAPRAGSALGETCVTTTWLHYCDCLYRMTGDPEAAGEAEKALYNGILGALAPDGTNWLHRNPTPLTGGGVKTTADDQIGRGFGTPFGGNDCCRAQGPEALALAPVFAVAPYRDGIAINLFEAADAQYAGGRLQITGDYPYGDSAEIRLSGGAEPPIFLRIVPWLKEVRLNGEALALPPSGYLEIRRRWRLGDRLKLKFDLSLREVPAPEGAPFYAVTRGPVVLAEDARGAVPAAVHAEYAGRALCDYASAGEPPNEDHALTVWFSR